MEKSKALSFAFALALFGIILSANVSAGWFDRWHDDDDDDDGIPKWMIYYSVLSRNNDMDIVWNGPYKGGNLLVSVNKKARPLNTNVCDGFRVCDVDSRDSKSYNVGNTRYAKSYSDSVRIQDDTARISSSSQKRESL